ncbi:MAG: VCBS repeat-containing protein, partial [Acidimicrobiia bacterium]
MKVRLGGFGSSRLLHVVPVVMALTISMVAHAAVSSIDLRSDWGMKIKENAGRIAAGGDINGDGLSDLLISGRRRGWIVFGQSDRGVVSTSALRGLGFKMIAAPETYLRLRDGGDVNGDGLADIIVGAPGARVEGRGTPGVAYVVFGKTDVEPIDLR